jgi:hypothetical protein
MLKNLMIGLLLLALMVSPMLALAQDDDIEWIEFESESGLVKVSYPDGWFVGTGLNEDDPSAEISVNFANNEELLEAISTSGEDEDVPANPGDKGGSIFALPAEFLAFFGVELTEETTAQELAEALGGVFFSEEEDGVADMESIEVIETEDQPDVGVVPFTQESENLEGVILVFLKDDFIVVGFIAAYTDEFDEEYRDLAVEVALTYEITLTAEELMGMMMGEE